MRNLDGKTRYTSTATLFHPSSPNNHLAFRRRCSRRALHLLDARQRRKAVRPVPGINLLHHRQLAQGFHVIQRARLHNHHFWHRLGIHPDDRAAGLADGVVDRLAAVCVCTDPRACLARELLILDPGVSLATMARRREREKGSPCLSARWCWCCHLPRHSSGTECSDRQPDLVSDMDGA